jgi:hypothetical protein
MGSVNSSTNTLLMNLLQNLATTSPQLSSILSAPNVQSALQNESPADLVQLSDQAVQLQQMSTLFGNPDDSQSQSWLTSPSDTIFPSLSSEGPDAASNLLFQTLEESTAPAGSTFGSINTLA